MLITIEAETCYVRLFSYKNTNHHEKGHNGLIFEKRKSQFLSFQTSPNYLKSTALNITQEK